MMFLNPGKATQVRIQEGPNRYHWKLLKPGKVIDLPEEVGVRYGFAKITVTEIKATEGKIGKTKVETKQFEKREDRFLKNLISINGIGKKTAKDLVLVFGTEDALIDSIKSGKQIPIRDDIEEKLRKNYG